LFFLAVVVRTEAGHLTKETTVWVSRVSWRIGVSRLGRIFGAKEKKEMKKYV
jgi:hypothetical protein